MGSGVSKRNRRATSQDKATSTLKESSSNSNTGQPHVQKSPQAQLMFIEDTDTKDEVNVTQAKPTEWHWHIQTRQRYQSNYPEQAESIQTLFDWIKALKSFVDDQLNQLKKFTYANVSEIVDGLANMGHQAYKSGGTNQFITIAEFIVDVQGVDVLQRLAHQCFKDYYVTPEDVSCFHCLKNVLGTIQWFSDIHHGFCLSCATAGVIPLCLKNVKMFDDQNANWENGNEDSADTVLMIYRCVGILHNIARRLRDREFFANCEETLLSFAKVKVPKIAVASLLCLAYLVNEETNHLILADENLLSFIVTMLNNACRSEDRRCSGFSAKELAEGLSYLAVNDTNKMVLGNNGAVHVLMSMLKTSSDDEERAIAVKALWMLAFDNNNKEAIRREVGGLKILRELQRSKDPDVQKAAAGTLWELEGKTMNGSEKSEVTQNHVMISYQWDNQEVLIEVKNRLQASGYRVWMDLEQMGGSTLEAMAKAVEDSSVILVCVAKKYKESPNCRSEAEYAYQLRKDIIPLMMQHNYRPDGWLGMIVGTKLWIDFQSKHVIEEGLRKLTRELRGRGKNAEETDESVEPVVRPVDANVVATQPSVSAVSEWTNKEVKQWLEEIGLENVCREDISEVNGQTLIDLQHLRGECPEYFYKCLEQNLNLRNMVDVFKFRKELQELIGGY